MELGYFDKIFVKKARKKDSAGKRFGAFSPRYSWNYILNGTFNPKMEKLGPFQNHGSFFDFQKRAREASSAQPLGCGPVIN